ncbi:MAG TPA: clostripain-related cysteine peptidase [Spirochaetota bacterium]|nr:hypothetical protein [Spirochaetota bacterium]HOD15000.1 clostripain-related cysteine peptidase [Spirochaetota bacterium]HPG49496.1 clostripain-related cysteine peptidase [Spirochaetota bacterium]HPN11525.1 clostripain-related cysteine peptidase [Spirochaetota bacterium]HQL82118.1 clostripain-related cysteine peptidase [Spirochaetota bacterium]
MNRLYYLKGFLYAALAGILLAGCEYRDPGTERDGADALALLAAAVPRIPNTERKLPLPQTKKQWTVMVYMDGDNNLSPYSAADVAEMMKSGSDANFNILVLWDTDPDQDQAGAKNRHGYYYIEKTGAVLLKDTGEVNMGDPATAKDFVAYAAKNFPAKKYMWVYWNHGGAVDRAVREKGVCWDDTSGGDHLTETEQTDIMAYAKKKLGRKIDIAGFDACLMATAEIAYQYAGTAAYLVASEQTIPGDGWDYRFLSKLKLAPSISARDLGKQILACYKNYYRAQGEEDVTLSLVYLARTGSLADALDDFTAEAMEGGTGGAPYRNASRGLEMFGLSGGETDSYYTKDLYSYLRAVAESDGVPDAARERAAACMELLRDGRFIVSEWHGPRWKDRAYGLAITLKHATAVYGQLDLCEDTGWDEFLNWAKFPDSDYAY